MRTLRCLFRAYDLVVQVTCLFGAMPATMGHSEGWPYGAIVGLVVGVAMVATGPRETSGA